MRWQHDGFLLAEVIRIQVKRLWDLWAKAFIFWCQCRVQAWRIRLRESTACIASCVTKPTLYSHSPHFSEHFTYQYTFLCHHMTTQPQATSLKVVHHKTSLWHHESCLVIDCNEWWFQAPVICHPLSWAPVTCQTYSCLLSPLHDILPFRPLVIFPTPQHSLTSLFICHTHYLTYDISVLIIMYA